MPKVLTMQLYPLSTCTFRRKMNTSQFPRYTRQTYGMHSRQYRKPNIPQPKKQFIVWENVFKSAHLKGMGFDLFIVDVEKYMLGELYHVTSDHPSCD